MPETDPAAVRERTDLIARGWPDYRSWTPDPDTLAALTALTEAFRQACSYRWKAVTDPDPPEVDATYQALVGGLEAAGLPRRLAEFSADASRALRMDVVGAVRWTAEPKPPGWAP